jgi:hypothetical protein
MFRLDLPRSTRVQFHLLMSLGKTDFEVAPRYQNLGAVQLLYDSDESSSSKMEAPQSLKADYEMFQYKFQSGEFTLVNTTGNGNDSWSC